jgi:hypothetical protein
MANLRLVLDDSTYVLTAAADFDTWRERIVSRLKGDGTTVESIALDEGRSVTVHWERISRAQILR